VKIAGLLKDRRGFWIAVVILLSVMTAAMVRSALLECQTWDEGIHLAAGYSYLKTGQFRLNPEHPPLFKLLAALPLLLLRPELPTQHPSWATANVFDFAVQFMYGNRVDADTILFWGRSVTILLTLLLGLALALWTRRSFGPAPALLALVLFSLDPNFIAHGHYVTNDLILALFVFLTVIAWVSFIETRRYRDLLMASLALGAALVTKYSGLLLAVILPLLYIVQWAIEWRRRRRGCQVPGRRLSLAHLAWSLIIAAVISVFVIAVAYWPEMARWRDGPRMVDAVNGWTPVGSTLQWLGKRFNLPAHPYLLGINALANFSKDGHDQYLLGRHSKHGWWYYFPVAFAVKTPGAVLLLAALALAAVVWLRRRPAPEPRAPGGAPALRWLAVILPAAVYFGAMMMSTIDLGVRYILPVYPFVFILIAAILFHPALEGFRQARRVVLAVALLFQGFEVASIHPHYLAFFNTFSGGPENGPRYLLDSNIDWGQDLKNLRAFLKAIGWQQPICVCYFGNANMTYYGIPYQYLPVTREVAKREDLDCLAAISVTPLNDVYAVPGSYDWLRSLKPMAKVGYSIYVYDLRKNKTPL
jgi:hypothetical protein